MNYKIIPSLQNTPDASACVIQINDQLATRLGFADADQAIVKQGYGQTTLPIVIDNRIPNECVYVTAGQKETRNLMSGFQPVALEKIE